MSLFACLLIFPIVSGVAAGTSPGTASLEGWRSAENGEGWHADSRRGVLLVDRHTRGSLIAANASCEKRVQLGFRVLESYSPWARLEIRVRSSGDERSYWAAAV